jgi:hypothetical protein
MVCPDPWRRHRSDWYHPRLGRRQADRRRRLLVLSFRRTCIDCRRLSGRATQTARRLDLCRRFCGHHDLGFLGSRPKRLAAGAAFSWAVRPLATRHFILAYNGRGTRTSAKAMGTRRLCVHFDRIRRCGSPGQQTGPSRANAPTICASDGGRLAHAGRRRLARLRRHLQCAALLAARSDQSRKRAPTRTRMDLPHRRHAEGALGCGNDAAQNRRHTLPVHGAQHAHRD